MNADSVGYFAVRPAFVLAGRTGFRVTPFAQASGRRRSYLALMFATVFSDPGNLAGPLGATLLRDLKIALWEWSSAIEHATVTVHLSVVDTIATADTAGEMDGVINMRINPAYFRKYADQNPAWLRAIRSPRQGRAGLLGAARAGPRIRHQPRGHGALVGDSGRRRDLFHRPHRRGRLWPAGTDHQRRRERPPGKCRRRWTALRHHVRHPHLRNYEQVISPIDLAILRDEGVVPASPKPAGLVELYLATFGRAPDAAGLAYWQQRLDAGMPLPAIAQSFTEQPEAQALFSGARLIENTYQHVLGRAADLAGLTYWTNALASGQVHEGQFVLAMIEGAQGDDARHIEHAADEYAVSVIGVVP